MAINKVVYGNTTLVDLTGTTATSDKILTGYGAYGKDGVWMNGSATSGGGIESVTQDQNGYVVLDDDEGNQIVVDSLSVTTNGTYTATTGHAYSPVSVNVPQGVTPTGTISITQNGTYNVTNYASAAVNVSSGGSSLVVKFIDYDGSLLYSYSASEFNALTAMPTLPTHTGLTSISWNYTLSDAKYAITSLTAGEMDIGVYYETTDGATHLFIELSQDRIDTRPDYTLVFGASTANGSIDWGDNSATTSILSEDNAYTHTYTSAGSYEIKISSTADISIGGTIDSTKFGLIKRPDTISATSFTEKTLKKIYLGSHVTTLGQYSFYHCYNLESIVIPTSVTVLDGSFVFTMCYSLKSITIPGTITTMPSNVISNNNALESILLSNGITTIQNSAINACFSVHSITLPRSVTTLSGGTTQWLNSGDTTYHFIKKITFLNGITTLPSYAMYNFFQLEEVNIPTSITNIATYCFYACRSLRNIDLPSSVTTLGNYAFSGCRNLLSIDISNVTSLGTYTFSDCSSLESISFADVTTVPERCLSSCSSLKELELPNKVTTIGSNALSGLTSLRTMNAPTSLKTINQYGMNGCKSLQWTSIPSTITSVGNYGFANLELIENVVIPSGLKTISTGAFQSAVTAKKLTIHSAVTSIAASGFANYYMVKEIHLQRTTPPTLSNVNAFNNLPSDCIIYVPKSDNHTVLDAYKAATNWSTYEAQMQEEPS